MAAGAAAPASNTRSKIAAHTATVKQSTRLSRLVQPVRLSKAKANSGIANAVEVRRDNRQLRRLTREITKMETEVYQAMVVMDAESGKLMNNKQLMRHPKYKGKWQVSLINEFRRLANGVGGRIKGTNTIKFIKMQDVPKDRMKDVTYGQFVCMVQPEKAEQNRTRFTVGGDRINHPEKVATPTAEILVAKLLFNSVVSTQGAKFMTMDISNFYLMTLLNGQSSFVSTCEIFQTR